MPTLFSSSRFRFLCLPCIFIAFFLFLYSFWFARSHSLLARFSYYPLSLVLSLSFSPWFSLSLSLSLYLASFSLSTVLSLFRSGFLLSLSLSMSLSRCLPFVMLLFSFRVVFSLRFPALSLSLIHLLLSVFISFFSLSRSAWFSFSLGFLLSLSLSLSLLLSLSLSLSSFRSFLFLWVAFPSFPLSVLFLLSLSLISFDPSFSHSVLLFIPYRFPFRSLSLSLPPFLSDGLVCFPLSIRFLGFGSSGAVGVALLISLKY